MDILCKRDLERLVEVGKEENSIIDTREQPVIMRDMEGGVGGRKVGQCVYLATIEKLHWTDQTDLRFFCIFYDTNCSSGNDPYPCTYVHTFFDRKQIMNVCYISLGPEYRILLHHDCSGLFSMSIRRTPHCNLIIMIVGNRDYHTNTQLIHWNCFEE